MFQVLSQLLEITNSKSKSVETLQAFCDGKCFLEKESTKKQPHLDCYWIALSTQIMNRLMTQEKQNTVVVLAAFCDGVSKLLLSDKTKLEKASHGASSRSILARALLTTTVASLYCLQNDDGKSLQALKAAVAALDRIIHLKSDDDDSWSSTNAWNLEDLQERCHGLPLVDVEETCVTSLQAADDSNKSTTATSSPPTKRAARTRRGGKASPAKPIIVDTTALHQAFEQLLQNSNQRIEVRVAVKRWGSMALVWLCQGQLQLLKTTHQVAGHDSSLSASQKSKLMNQMVEIVSEAGDNCGLRPPTGGMDQYLRSIWPNKKSTKKSKLTRVDIRDWATIVIYDLVQVHRQCLQHVSTKVVNELDGVEEKGEGHDDQSAFVAPALSTALSSLCRTAASSVANSTYLEQSEWTKSLTSIAAAQCLQLAVEPELPLDCKITNFALTHLEGCLRLLEPQRSQRAYSAHDVMDDEEDVHEYQKWERLFSLKDPLPTPSESGIKDPDDSSFPLTHVCNFAGVLPSSSTGEFDDEEAVALVIRALYSKSDTDPPAATLVSTLTDIVRRAYDTRKPKDSAEKTDEESTPSKDKKRPARGVGRRNTRRKGDTGEVVVEREEWHRITPQRALIATEALNVLRLCLLIQSNPPSPLRQSIRQTLSSTHIEKILELGELLDKVLVKTRLDAVRLPPGDNEASTSPPDNLFSTESTGGGHANDFTHYEKPLWSAHMTMCQVLGRGHTSFDASLSTQPIFGPDVDREKNYKALAALHNTNIRKVWPLSLPAAHHCFLVANLTREPIDAVEYSAEKYIAKGYIESIGHVLQNLGSLNSNEWKPEHLYLDDEIPLAHRDARTLLVAISRLPLLKQRACVEELIGLTNNALKSIQGNKSKRENLLSNGEASSLVARVVVTCMSLVNVITSGSSVRESLFAHVGSVQINLPPFITSSEWYRCERCFMGIFADWEFPSFPDVSNTSSSMALKEKTMKDLRSILDITFELGFETARKDHCHLLFAAWNGLGQLGATRGPQRISNSHTNRDDFPKKILQLRDDVCFVHKEINQSDHSRTMPASTLKRNLKNMLDKAESIVGTVLDEYVPNGKEMANDVPTSTFALLTALPSYISSSIAGHTKPGNDFFSTTLSKAAARQSKRQRGYSSESDAVHSDGDSVETDGGGYESDVRVDALSRLRECCDAFGTSPIHPDWLDVSCSLREGIRYTDAIDVSEKAIRTLTRLTVAAFSQYKRFYFEAIKAYHQDDKNLDSRVNLCMNLCQWTSHEPAASSLLGPGPYPDDREWKDDIATVCDLQQDVLELLVDESLIKNVEQARESWCPNAAQRLVGRLQDRNRLIGGWETSTAELRAGGEWELLLSEALTISCLDVKDFPVDSESKTEISERAAQRGHEALVKAQLWRTIFMNAASHLMPAAALLRLGLGKVGRKPHPFSFHENNQDPYDVTPLQFSERLNGIVTASPSLKETVFETMCTLARLCAEGDDNLTATCHAIAAHLVVDSKSFSDLEGLQCIRFAFTGLKRIRELAEMSSNEEEIFKVVPFLAERLTSVIEDFGRIPKSKSAQIVDASEEFRRLFSFFVASGARLLDTVVENSVEVFKILTTGNVKEIDEDGIETYQWSDQNRQSLVITDFVSALCGDALRANERTRSCIVLVLSRIADLESRLTFPPKTRYASSVVPGIIDAFNSIDNKRLKTLVLQELCCLSPPPDQALLQDLPSLSYRKDLANLFAFLLSTRGDAKAFNRSKVLFDSLIESFDGWSKLKQEDREHILDLLFLYGCRFNTLNEIGSRLITRASSTSEEDQAGEIEILTKFFGYIRDLQAALVTSSKRKATTTSKESSKNDPNQRRGSSGGGSVHEPTTEHPSSCSFVQKSGFHGQHWYNCYTCGLVWDKGCCTLCALVCHRGHDVSYSRFSSFFCDCGAEDGSAAEQSRVACKCLSSLAADQVGIFFKNEATGNLLEPTPLSPQPGHSQQVNNGITTSIGIEIARDSFNDIALSSIKNFTGNARESPWLDSLFSIVRHQFETWKSAKSTKSNLESLLTDKGRGRDTKPIFRVSHQSLRKSLRNRKARVLDLQRLGEKTMIPARAAKGFQVKMSSDTSTNAHMLSRLSRHEISRSVLAADSRGRMIIAEPCSLVFCSAISAVSIRHVSRPYETPLSRNQMCIVGTASMKFNIVGLRTCAENERHLVVWGTSEACVAVLKPNWDGVEEKIDLIFDINQHDGEGDYLVKCEWIPGSQTHVAVGCSRFVRIYNIARSNSDKRALPVIGYNLGFEASLRDVTIVPYKGYAGVEDGAESGGTFESEKVSKMFLLLENGRLHVVDLKTSPNGRLESPGDQHFEPSECIALGTAGVRPRSGSSIGQPGATTRTLGEGSQLTYLKQSRVLLYKCTSSCVLALMLDTKGDVEGTFELIPHTISSEILGNGPDGYSITGPFTHWTELGVAYRNGAAFFRVACVGRSSRSNQPKLLCIEFNESDVRIKEIVWLSGSSVGLGLSLSASYEGLVAFSAPFIGDASSDSRMLGERVFLCAVTSNGSLLFFGEETVDTIPSQESDDGTESASPLKLVNLSGIAALQTKKPVFPLTLFEKLKNVSDSDDVVFGGESLGRYVSCRIRIALMLLLTAFIESNR